MSEKYTPQNGDLYVHQHHGIVEIIKPWGNAASNESVCELVLLRPRVERRILSNSLMMMVGKKQSAAPGTTCDECQKVLVAGTEFYRIDSPGPERGGHGKDLQGSLCYTCMGKGIEQIIAGR